MVVHPNWTKEAAYEKVSDCIKFHRGVYPCFPRTRPGPNGCRRREDMGLAVLEWLLGEFPFWKGIEMMKDGYSYDKRHHFKDRLNSNPFVCIKCNRLPQLQKLSSDRWVIWMVDPDDNTLMRWTPKRERNITDVVTERRTKRAKLDTFVDNKWDKDIMESKEVKN